MPLPIISILNPWFLLGALVFVAIVSGTAFLGGVRYARADYLAAVLKEQKLEEKIRGDIRTLGNQLSTDLETGFSNIKVENKTINRYIKREKEVHHVLTNPDCAYPDSTVRLLNSARSGKSPTGAAASKPAAEVRPAGATQ